MWHADDASASHALDKAVECAFETLELKHRSLRVIIGLECAFLGMEVLHDEDFAKFPLKKHTKTILEDLPEQFQKGCAAASVPKLV